MINHTPSQEIIVKTLLYKMMVMLGSQPMTPMLCQVFTYFSLEEDDEHKEREIYSTIKDVPHLLIEDVMC